MLQNETKYIPSGYTKKIKYKLEIPLKVLAHQAMFITKSEKSTC